MIDASTISCPVCHSGNSRRSKRRSVLDHLFSIVGILPWRCEDCAARFYARPLPFSTFLYAHCGICGNSSLQRISGEHVPGVTAVLGRFFGLPALRCAPCRHKFFSIRPLRREQRPVAPAPTK